LLQLLALDPGGTTGWAEWSESTNQVTTGELTGEEHHLALWALLENFRLDGISNHLTSIVVCESFEFRKDERFRHKINYDAAEYVGVVKVYCQYWKRFTQSIDLVVISASTAKGFWDDDKLRRAGYYIKGSKHVRDAVRHLLRYRTFVLNDHDLLRLLK
jgi:hypothetical protein